MNNNVVDINALREKRSKRQAEAEEWIKVSSLPPQVEEQLNVENEKVLALVQHMNATLDAYAEGLDDKTPQSTLIPVEALARMASGILTKLDAHINPAVVQQQNEFRIELADELTEYMIGYCEQRAMVDGVPVFQHDMYLSLIGALLTVIFDHRMTQIISRLRGETSGEERRTEDVQEERPE